MLRIKIWLFQEQIHNIAFRWHLMVKSGAIFSNFLSCVHCKPQSFQLIFSKFTTYILIPRPWCQLIFQGSAVPFLATGRQSSFFLYVPYNCYPSADLFQICTKYSLYHAPGSSTFSPSISYICGHQGANFVFLALLTCQSEKLIT